MKDTAMRPPPLYHYVIRIHSDASSTLDRILHVFKPSFVKFLGGIHFSDPSCYIEFKDDAGKEFDGILLTRHSDDNVTVVDFYSTVPPPLRLSRFGCEIEVLVYTALGEKLVL